MRTVTDAMPDEIATHDGLAYSLWLPKRQVPPKGGVVILHGAGSCKESHHDYARLVLAAGFAAIAFDQRGHGASGGRLDGRVIEDTAAIAELLRAKVGDPEHPIALRGSSMGGYLAIVAAAPTQAAAVVAICPASASGLRRALAAGAFQFDVDVEAVDSVLAVGELDPVDRRARDAAAAAARRRRRAGPSPAFTRARGPVLSAGQPADHSSRRSPPLSPARR